MEAIVYHGPRDVALDTVDDAVLEDPEDVVIEVTSSAICGTDLYMYDGPTACRNDLRAELIHPRHISRRPGVIQMRSLTPPT
jgi:threonine dehydrogenase-like Zn-dependent dehydrogenase